MKDEPETTEVEATAPRAANITIPRQVLEDWVAIPQGDYVDIRLTRLDLDRLYSVFDELAASHRSLATALIEWSHERRSSAEQNLTASFAHSEAAISQLRLLYTAIMVSAIRGRSDVARQP